MRKNIGNADRVARIVLGIVFGVLYLGGTMTGTVGLILFVVGIVFFLTALVGFCPIYATFGLSTRHKAPPAQTA